jgi:hypothetical protein
VQQQVVAIQVHQTTPAGPGCRTDRDVHHGHQTAAPGPPGCCDCQTVTRWPARVGEVSLALGDGAPGDWLTVW